MDPLDDIFAAMRVQRLQSRHRQRPCAQRNRHGAGNAHPAGGPCVRQEIGRASCRERV